MNEFMSFGLLLSFSFKVPYPQLRNESNVATASDIGYFNIIHYRPTAPLNCHINPHSLTQVSTSKVSSCLPLLLAALTDNFIMFLKSAVESVYIRNMLAEIHDTYITIQNHFYCRCRSSKISIDNLVA